MNGERIGRYLLTYVLTMLLAVGFLYLLIEFLNVIGAPSHVK